MEKLIQGIGRWLRGLRAMQGLSIDTLAARSALSVARIEDIEQGHGAVIDIAEMNALLKVIEPGIMARMVEFALTVGAASESAGEASELSHLASRIVGAFGGVPSPATRNAVAELMEAVAGYGGRRRLHA
ncbi:hypothetical protein D3874_16535 [Oleomonas cavernae]|uniref:Uncharacterized protein n=1 Tax=Oleomonas cavernae TaxID=2320859 RepID=A0A418WEH9_9PROT|nr:helix-turn-helix domain-containing protein [Oleomonas cavernae]RJF88423.1 hypothetical protein D3874_16535 [Oleomonas cavernae]